MARSPKEAIVIVLDVGQSVSEQRHQDGATFLERSKSCILRILERKIFSLSKDEIGMVFVGSKETANALEYENISIASSLRLASWEMLEMVEKVQGTNVSADWLDGVVVAMQVLKDDTEGKKFLGKKIVLFTNCTTAVDDSHVDVILKGMQGLEVELTVIGPNIIPPSKEEQDSMDVDGDSATEPVNNGLMKKVKSEEQEAGEATLARIVEETGGVICSFDDALPQLMFYQKKSVRPTPWNVCLDIGQDINIPISGFRKIAEATVPSWKTISNVEETAPIDKERSYFKKDKTTVDKEDIIEGYSFGSTLVPFNVYDKDTMSYKSGDKCFSVLGFTKMSNIPRHLMDGIGVYYFVTQKDKPEAMPAFSAFTHGLKDLDMVAVVRKVYNNNNAPVIGVLFPKIKQNYQCLVFVELPYSEDIREFIFPSLTSQSNKPTNEQLQSIDSLIDNMDLMYTEDGGDVEEAFHPKRTLLPYHQHLYHSLAHRALHPGEDLLPVSSEIKQLLKCPFESKDGYKIALESIKKHFELTEVKPKNPYRRRGKEDVNAVPAETAASKDEPADLANMNIDDLTKPSIVEVGTVKPEQDFQTLLEKGEPLEKVCAQMQKVILSLVIGSFGADNFPKAQSALKTLRTTCCEKDPRFYNDWLPEFRTSILERGKDVFWELITENKLGLISVDENPASSITEEAAANFLEIKQEATMETAQDGYIDSDDLLNEM